MRLLLLVSVVTWHVTCSNVILKNKQRGCESVGNRLEALRAVTRGAHTFSPNFYKVVGKTLSGNVVCSPISAYLLLSMMTSGARGNTKEQLLNALALPRNTSLSGFQAFIDNFKNYNNVELVLANKIYLADGFTPKSRFIDVISRAFRSEVESVDFGNLFETTSTINGWCRVQTNNLIKDLFGPGDIGKDTILVLVSAVYFRGNWAVPFDPAKTRQNTIFNVNSNMKKYVPMMTNFDNFSLGELPEINARFVELPYKSEGFGNAVSMFIILPDKIDADLAKLEKNMKKFSVDKLLLRGRVRKVYVGLPRFKIESKIPVKDVLVQMGLTDMFSNVANFTGIVDSLPLKVSKVVQKVFIEVNEEGSEGSATSGSSMIPRTIGRKGPQIFIANHPFIIIIAIKGEYPVNLFIARYTGP